MKGVVLLSIFAVLFILIGAGCKESPSNITNINTEQKTQDSTEVSLMVENIKWLGHASFKLTGEKIIYIDPWKIKGGEKADIVLITHEHYDHCSPEDIARIVKEDTVIVTVADCQSKVLKSNKEIKLVEPGTKVNVKGIQIEAVPAYNTNKQYHLKENQWVGFIVTINGKRIYHAGDTDFIPEMSQLKNIDVALLPIGGTYTMNAQEAAQAANTIKPKVAVPMHVGDIVGSRADIEKFKSLTRVPVTVLEESQ